MVTTDILNGFCIKGFYKGTFLSYVDKDYKESENLDAYIDIKDLILHKPSTTAVSKVVKPFNILNEEELMVNYTVTSMSAIKCKPLYVNHIYPYLEEGESVFVFMIDEDPKKIFYLACSNDKPLREEFAIRIGDNVISVDKKNGITLRVGYNVITIDKNEISLKREMGDEKNDMGITVSRRGIEFSTPDAFIVNGENYIDLFNRNKNGGK